MIPHTTIRRKSVSVSWTAAAVRLIASGVLLALVTAGACAAADEAGAPSPPPAAASRTTTAAKIRIFNRTIAVLRGSFIGVPAAERAERAQEVIERLLNNGGGSGEVTLEELPQGYAIKIDGAMAFIMVSEDADWLRQETLSEAAGRSASELRQAVREAREAGNASAMIRAAGMAAAATLVFLLTIWLLRLTRSRGTARLSRLAHAYSERLSVGGESLIHRDRIFSLVGYGISLVYWLVVSALCFEWLGFVLARFPYTRPWGEQLNNYLVSGAASAGKAVAHAIPGMIIALLIFLTARLVTGFLGSVFERIQQGRFEIAGLDRDTVRPTRRLIAAAVWLFAVAMAYPYLPGAQTAAFKGLSVLVGLMVSLGGSSLVGQAASGLILMYTRTLRPGEYIQVASNEGTVMELGMFATRIRTGMGEELTLPNSLILGNVTKNYSRTVQGPGYILDTTVTIGYDTPWRQIHAMLAEAARRTEGVLTNPAPQVFQTALSDFYPEYRLVCQAVPGEPRPRAEVMNMLHANIQDVFNEYGVQIMSPHYRSDPAEAKIVPRENWAPPPAGGNDTSAC